MSMGSLREVECLRRQWDNAHTVKEFIWDNQDVLRD